MRRLLATALLLGLCAATHAQPANADAALKHRIACVAGWRGYVESGALASYAPEFRAIFHRAAYYGDRILKGARAQDLPVEQPSKFELVVNLKTAAAIGIAIPKAVLLRADEVIE